MFAVEVGVALFAAVEVGCCGEVQSSRIVSHDLASVVDLDALRVLHLRQDDEGCPWSPVAPFRSILVGDDLEAAHCPPS